VPPYQKSLSLKQALSASKVKKYTLVAEMRAAGFKWKEIQTAFGITAGTVGSMLRTARKRDLEFFLAEVNQEQDAAERREKKRIERAELAKLSKAERALLRKVMAEDIDFSYSRRPDNVYRRGIARPPIEPTPLGKCSCGGLILYRGRGRVPTQCDECRLNTTKQRAMESSKRRRGCPRKKPRATSLNQP